MTTKAIGITTAAAVVLVACIVGLVRVSRDAEPIRPAEPRTEPLRLGPELPRSVGLADGARLVAGSDDLVVLAYDAATDPTDLAASWSVVLLRSGMERVNDLSRPGRTVQRYANDETHWLLACGRAKAGAFVTIASDTPANSWLTGTDEQAPAVVRALLPAAVTGNPEQAAR